MTTTQPVIVDVNGNAALSTEQSLAVIRALVSYAGDLLPDANILFVRRSLTTGHFEELAARSVLASPASGHVDVVSLENLVGYVLGDDRPLNLHAGDNPNDLIGYTPAPFAQLFVPIGSLASALVLTRADNFTENHVMQLAEATKFAEHQLHQQHDSYGLTHSPADLQILLEAANALSWSLDLGQVLNTVTQQMMRSLQAQWCIISAWDSRANEIRHLTEQRNAIWLTPRSEPLDLDRHPLHQRSLNTRRPVTGSIDDLDLPSGERTQLEASGYRRMLSIPLQVNGRIYGLAELGKATTGGSFDDEKTGQALRIALGLGRLLRQGKFGDWQNEIAEMCRLMRAAAKADWCTLYVNDLAPDHFRRLCVFGQVMWVEKTGPGFDLSGLPSVRIVAEEQRITTLRHNDAALTPGEKALFDKAGSSALLILPLVSQTETVGILQLFDLDPTREFKPRELAQARALSNQAAVALENARLVRDLQISLERQQAMQSHMVRAARLAALGELSAVIAHQINNPLTTVIGDASMIVEDVPEGDPTHESAQAILRAGKRARLVVERVLNLGRHEDEASKINLIDTIHDTLDLLGVQIEAHGVRVHMDDMAEPIWLLAIPGQLEDVWMNLLTNATDSILESERASGEIHISCQIVNEGTHVEVSVADNGMGIDHTTLETVFDPTYTTKPRGKGTGLGLYICKQIINDHDGTISLDSAPGQGTEVRVRLPLYVESRQDSTWHMS